jgi:predicted Zn-dependent protease
MSRVLKQLFKQEQESSPPHLRVVEGLPEAEHPKVNYTSKPVKSKNRSINIIFAIGLFAAIYLSYKLFSHRITEKDLKEQIKPAEEIILHPDHQLNRNGIRELESRNYKKALETFSQLAKVHPSLSSAQNNLGFALLRNNRIREAKEKFKKSIKLDPANYIAHVNLAMALLEDKKYEEAAKSLKQALLLNKEYPDTYLNLGKVYEMGGKFKEAIESYESYLKLVQSKKLLKGLIQNRIKKLKSLTQYQEPRREEFDVDLQQKN